MRSRPLVKRRQTSETSTGRRKLRFPCKAVSHFRPKLYLSALLRQPGGFEGFLPIREADVPTREPVLESEQIPDFQRHLEPIPTPPTEREQGKNPIVAHRLNALNLDEKRLPWLTEGVPKTPKPLSPPIDASVSGNRCDVRNS